MELSIPQHTALRSRLSFRPSLGDVYNGSSMPSRHSDYQYMSSTPTNRRRQSNSISDNPRISWCEPRVLGQAGSQRPRPELKYQYTFHASQQLDTASPLDGDNRIENPRNGALYPEPASSYAFTATWPRRTIMACIYCRQRKVRWNPRRHR